MSYISRNPYTAEISYKAECIADSQLDKIITRAGEEFARWKRTPLKTRSRMLLSLAELLEKEAEHHAAIISTEMGKPVKQAVAEVKKSALACRYYSGEAEKILRPYKIHGPAAVSTVYYEPQGIVFAIMPWNFPYWQVVRCIAPALASGNTVILKHASNVPRCAMALEDVVKRAGFTEGLFANLFISHKQVEKVINASQVRSVSLTGSNLAGEKVASQAGLKTKKCVLELGGSDPFIVFADADIKAAAEAAVLGRFQNNGQSCIAAKRLFVHQDIYNEFMESFTRGVDMLITGNPMDADTDIGPLVNEKAVDDLRKQVAVSIEMGATIRRGNLYSKHGKAFFDPMVLENVPHGSPVATEETFGPVIPVFSFSDYNKLIEQVNSTSFGLGSSVWTHSDDVIERVSHDIDSGTVSVNGFTRSDPALPFGGVKSSGYGRELAGEGMREFMNIKTVTVYN